MGKRGCTTSTTYTSKGTQVPMTDNKNDNFSYFLYPCASQHRTHNLSETIYILVEGRAAGGLFGDESNNLKAGNLA